MGPVWALLLLLFPIAQGADLTCDARQNNTQCYGALGGTMKIQLMDKGSTTERCVWGTKKKQFLDWRINRFTTNKLIDRSEFNASTRIFHLHNLSKDDTDSYTLDFYEYGVLKKKLTHKIIIEAPVSSVQLKPECLSKGEMKVICTAEGGDSPEFSWSLNGQNLTDSQLLSKNDTNHTITLKQNTKGLLRCSVKNHVSQDHKELKISTCGYTFINCTLNGTQISDWVFEANNTLCIEQTTPAAPSTPVAAYWPKIAGVLVIVLITAVVLFFVLKKICWDKRGLKTSQPEPGLELSVI